jgi:hypothetical protein
MFNLHPVPGAVNSYINGIKISPTEKELVFGLPGTKMGVVFNTFRYKTFRFNK